MDDPTASHEGASPPITAPDAPESPAPGSSRARDLIVSAITASLGLAVVVFLTRYNMQVYPVWSPSLPAMGRSWEEYLLVNITGLLLIPLVAILVMPAEAPAAYGWARPTPSSARIAAGMYLPMLVVLYIASGLPAFQQYYPIQPQAAQMWGYLLYFELTYGMYMLTWEFFFRGFLTFGMSRGFGPVAAVILQAVAFGVMHVGKPLPEIIGSFIAGIVLGVLALKGKSFLHCFALHWACSVTFDMLVIRAVPGGLF